MGLASSYDAADASPGFLLWKVSNLHQRLQRRALSALDLTPTQFSVLACFADLSSSGAALTQADVCAFAALDKMIVSDATRSLVAKGFLEKKPSQTDKRASHIKLTTIGRAVCTKAVRVVETLDSTFFAPGQTHQPLVLQLQAILAADDTDTSDSAL